MNDVMSREQKLGLLLVVLCAFAVNANTLLNGFVYDDVSQVVNNPWITSFKYLPTIFTHDATRAPIPGISNYYRPLMHVVYLANYYVFWGLTAWGFHLVNVLFHVGVTVMVYFVAAALWPESREGEGAFFTAPLMAALIFAVHPVHTEAIAWVACVPELTFSLFCLLSFYCFIKYLNGTERGSYWWCVGFFAVAVFCKETAVTILPVMVLYDLLHRHQKKDLSSFFARYVPFVVVMVAYAAIRMNALGGVAPYRRHGELSGFQLFLNVFTLFSQYLEKLIVPINLNAFYVLHPALSVTDPLALFSLVVTGLFVALAVVLWKRDRVALLGLAIIVVSLLPVLYIPVLGENSFTDRYMYFPSVGFALAAGSLLGKVRKASLQKPLYALLVVTLLVYSVGTFRRNAVWHDEYSLWTDTVAKSPDSCLVHHNMGNSLAERGDLDGAINEFQAGLKYDANSFDVHNSLGVALSKKGDFDGAIKELEIALAIMPGSYNTYSNLGIAYARKGDLSTAIKAFEKAVSLDGESFQGHNNLGNAYAMTGNLDGAIKEYQAALTIKPDFPDARNNLTIALGKKQGTM